MPSNAVPLLNCAVGMPPLWSVLYCISTLPFHFISSLLLLTSVKLARVGSSYIVHPEKYFGDLLILNHFSWQAEGLETNESGERPGLSTQAAVH